MLFAAGHEMALVLAASVLDLVLVLEGCIVGVEVGTAVEESVMSTLLKTKCKFLKRSPWRHQLHVPSCIRVSRSRWRWTLFAQPKPKANT